MSVPVAAALAAGTLILGAPILVATATATAGTLAASAADSAALAAADNLIGLNSLGSSHWNGSDSGGVQGDVSLSHAGPCGVAAEIVGLHGAVLHSCTISDELLEVRVEVRTRAGPLSLTRVARAGPPNVAALGESDAHG